MTFRAETKQVPLIFRECAKFCSWGIKQVVSLRTRRTAEHLKILQMMQQQTDDDELLMCNELWMECPDRSPASREEEEFRLSEHENEPTLCSSLQHSQHLNNHATLNITPWRNIRRSSDIYEVLRSFWVKCLLSLLLVSMYFISKMFTINMKNLAKHLMVLNYL